MGIAPHQERETFWQTPQSCPLISQHLFQFSWPVGWHLQSPIDGKSRAGEGLWSEAQLREAQMAVPRQKGEHSVVFPHPGLAFLGLGDLKLDMCWVPAFSNPLGFSLSAPVTLKMYDMLGSAQHLVSVVHLILIKAL